MVPNSKRIDLTYDGRLRLRLRAESNWSGSNWLSPSTIKYIYDGNGVYICGDYTSHRIFGLKQRDRKLEVVRQIGTAGKLLLPSRRMSVEKSTWWGMNASDLSGKNFEDGMTTISAKP